MCQLAHINGERTPVGGGCNEARDSNWYVDRNVVKTCDERRLMAAHHGLTFMGVERWMDTEFCDFFNYVALVRDPLDRIVSNLEYKDYSPSDAMAWSSPGVSHFDSVIFHA